MVAVANQALFLGGCVAIAMLWNRLFEPVPWSIIVAFVAIVAGYQAKTLFTSRVDVPGGLACWVYPWKPMPCAAAHANTGIVFTQLVPWTRVARDAIRAGEWPLWNRYSAAGAPVLGNQQTAIFHPFTLCGVLLLTIGKAFTFSAGMRLFTVFFFTFVLLRGHGVRTAAAVYGAAAFTFCTFHVVWLLFPLGLVTMMLPVALVGAQEVATDHGFRAWLLLTSGLALAVLGGHPESAFWVWVVVASYATVFTADRPRLLLRSAIAFIMAGALTAFWWMPTVGLLPHISRTKLMHSRATNPPYHGLSAEWIETLVAPNILGTPQTDSYTPPRHRHPAVLDDYGEIASGYAGIITLGLAASALVSARRKPMLFFAGLQKLVELRLYSFDGLDQRIRSDLR